MLLPSIMPINHCARRRSAPTLAGTRTEVDYPVMPVIAETPCCRRAALRAAPRHRRRVGRGARPRAADAQLFHDAEGRLRGFCRHRAWRVQNGRAVAARGADRTTWA
ncbi:MAG: hypothetical protein U5K43_00345 [Halofilum sp. (in: g-proteobacteria)]|nr:hypothetical protein [Halofilum sp. (in: g-proteobacteria)]